MANRTKQTNNTMYKEEELINIKQNILNEVTRGKSIEQISKLNKFPSKYTIYELLKKDKDFSNEYARSKELYLMTEAIEIIDKIDNCKEDKVSIMKMRLQYDARIWFLSKLNPKKYGSTAQNQTNIQIVQPITGMQIIDLPEEDQETGQ